MNEPLPQRTGRQIRIGAVRARGSRLIAWFFIAYIPLTFALWALGFLHTKARPLGGNEPLWIGLLLVAYSPWLATFPVSWVRLRESGTPRRKRVWIFVATNIGLCSLYYPAIFGGVPKLLHYVNHSPADVVTTITGKNDWVGRSHFCTPRIDLAVISAPTYGDICVSRKFFEGVKVGDRVRVHGELSRFAIEPTEIRPIR